MSLRSTCVRFLPAILLAAILIGCGSQNDLVVVRSDVEFSTIDARAKAKAKEPLEKFAREEELTDEDRKALEEARRDARSLVAYRPNAIPPNVFLGYINQALGENEEAIMALRQVLANQPPNPEGEMRYLITDVHRIIAACLFDLKRYEESAAEFDRAIALSPERLEIKMELAQVLIQLEQYSRAEFLLDEVLAEDPSNARADAMKRFIRQAQSGGSETPPNDET